MSSKSKKVKYNLYKKEPYINKKLVDFNLNNKNDQFYSKQNFCYQLEAKCKYRNKIYSLF